MHRRTWIIFAAVAATLLPGAWLLRRSPSVAPPAPSDVAPTAAPATAVSMDSIERAEQRTYELTNEARRREGLLPLAYDRDLAVAARRHSEDMLRRGFFDHTNPDRETLADRVARLHPTGAVGENIWSWSGAAPPDLASLAGQAVADWMASPVHRANITKPIFTRVGNGAAAGASDLRLTQLFAE